MSFLESLKYRLVGWLAGTLLRLWFCTCRVEIEENKLMEQFVKPGLSTLVVTWHRAAIYGIYYMSTQCRAAIMISRSKDGEYLARLARNLGMVPVRGSSGRGGSQALDEMVSYMKEDSPRYAATVGDGPKGPRYEAKKGMVVLAMRTGLPLMTYMWSCDRAWIFKKAWDKTMLPKPFSRIVVKAGRIFTYPPEMSQEEIETACQELSGELNRLTREVDAKVGYIDPA
jgi:lysophospholipid acyltransferase (LPLAT)-like uncharacterized protein